MPKHRRCCLQEATGPRWLGAFGSDTDSSPIPPKQTQLMETGLEEGHTFDFETTLGKQKSRNLPALGPTSVLFWFLALR